MRKTEIGFGIIASASGLLLSFLSLYAILPYSAEIMIDYPAHIIRTYSIICMAAHVVGFAGALLVMKNHVLGSIVMAVVMINVLIFGFPWQSIPAVLYIISVVLAMVPVKKTA